MNEILLQLYCPCSGARSRPLLLLAMLAVAAVSAAWVARRSGEKGGSSMSAVWKVVIVAALAAAIIAVFALRQGKGQKTNVPVTAVVPAVAAEPGNSLVPPAQANALPRLVDVGAGTCIPCKMMMPVLAELKTRYAGRLSVEYCDIRDDPNAVQKYRIMVIPTQVLYDASGKELFRHEGFWPQAEIEKKLAEMGVQ